jgi:hypothetical protein
MFFEVYFLMILLSYETNFREIAEEKVRRLRSPERPSTLHRPDHPSEGDTVNCLRATLGSRFDTRNEHNVSGGLYASKMTLTTVPEKR